MYKRLPIFGAGLLMLLSGCSYLDEFFDENGHTLPLVEDAAGFQEIGQLTLAGGSGAAEISAYDPATKRLFVVNNAGSSRIDVVDLQSPGLPQYIHSIDITAYGGGVNSVAVKEGMLAAAIEGQVKQDPGQVLVFDTHSYDRIAQVAVGALPDMLTFSPDGAYIVSANEGEPSSDYTVDPLGTVSIISVRENFRVETLDFSRFNNQQTALEARGLRVFGPNASLAQDLEPEYVAIADNSATAWVSLQENNAIATIDLLSKTITTLQPLGFKDFAEEGNAFDASDRDGAIHIQNWPVKGIYMPDALAHFSVKGVSYILSANEGDAREYNAFEEEARIKDLQLDPKAFPEAELLQQNETLGRLKVTTTLGQRKKNGAYEELFSFGARSFSIWNGQTGKQVWDSGNELEQRLVEASLYPDDRSDDKGAEPEGVAVGTLGGRTIAFVGAERADAIVSVDVTDPKQPQFLQVLPTGDAPEGILFIPAAESPTKRSLLVVSSEGDGTVKVYQAGAL